MSLNRNYNYKDLHMLLACKSVVKSFSSNINELSVVKPEWTSDFIQNLGWRVDSAIEKSIDSNDDQQIQETYSTLCDMCVPVIRDVSYFKQVVEGDFKKDVKKKKKILKDLGFTDYLNNAQKRDQEALINLLKSMEQNFDSKLRTEFENNGVDSRLIDKVEQYTTDFKGIQLPKHIFKNIVKNPKELHIKEFNEIYDIFNEICKVASNYYRFESEKQDMFMFKKIADNVWSIKALATIK